MQDDSSRSHQDPTTASAPATARVPEATVESRDILQGRNCVTIAHKGVNYRLQETRAGKLILTK